MLSPGPSYSMYALVMRMLSPWVKITSPSALNIFWNKRRTCLIQLRHLDEWALPEYCLSWEDIGSEIRFVFPKEPACCMVMTRFSCPIDDFRLTRGAAGQKVKVLFSQLAVLYLKMVCFLSGPTETILMGVSILFQEFDVGGEFCREFFLLTHLGEILSNPLVQCIRGLHFGSIEKGKVHPFFFCSAYTL